MSNDSPLLDPATMPALDHPGLPADLTVLRYADPATVARHQHQGAAGDLRVYPSRMTEMTRDGRQGDPLGSGAKFLTVSPSHPEGK